MNLLLPLSLTAITDLRFIKSVEHSDQTRSRPVARHLEAEIRAPVLRDRSRDDEAATDQARTSPPPPPGVVVTVRQTGVAPDMPAGAAVDAAASAAGPSDEEEASPSSLKLLPSDLGGLGAEQPELAGLSTASLTQALQSLTLSDPARALRTQANVRSDAAINLLR